MPLSLTGTGFRGYGNGEGSSGGYNSSATNYPLTQIRSAANEQMQWLDLEHFSGTTYKAEPLVDFPGGTAWVTVFVNGIPSLARSVQIADGQRQPFPWPMLLPAIINKAKQ
jgi:hypothetical protein